MILNICYNMNLYKCYWFDSVWLVTYYNENQEKTNELLQSLDLIKDNNCKEQFIREYIMQAAESKLRWELINLEREQKIIADYLIKF